jgi:hypothetical protein
MNTPSSRAVWALSAVTTVVIAAVGLGMAGVSDSTVVTDSGALSSDANHRPVLPGVSSQIPSLQFVHPVQGYAVRMDDDGIALSKSGWSASLRVAQVGTAGRMQPVAPAEPVLHDDLVEWDHGAVSSWIAADHGTLEQGFALQQRPEGDGEVRITLDLETSLRPEVFADGACIVMRDPLGVPVLAYENLFVYDGRGRTLAAEMRLDPHGDIVIAVDDRGAEYPITVDPDLTDVSDGGVSLFVARTGAQTDGSTKIRFGWNNYGTTALAIPAGPANRFTAVPVGGLLVPPTLIQPGRFELPFTVVAPGATQTWVLSYRTQRADGSTSTVTKTTSAGTPRGQVSPILERGGFVTVGSTPERRIATWGYLNRLPYPVEAPIGTGLNRFTGPALTPAPTLSVFQPGRRVGVFSTEWDSTQGRTVVWSLLGKTATADAGRLIVPNRAPVATMPSGTVDLPAGSTSVAGWFSDPDGDPLVITVTKAPAGSALVITGATVAVDVGTWGADLFAVQASDGRGGFASATVSFTGWLPYETASGSMLTARWAQFPNPRITTERQYDLRSGVDAWAPAWGNILSFRTVAPGFGIRGPGVFADIRASKYPAGMTVAGVRYPDGVVFADFFSRGVERRYDLTSHVPVAAGQVVTLQGAVAAHAWVGGWTTRSAYAAGQPVMTAWIRPALGQTWILPPGSAAGLSAAN